MKIQQDDLAFVITFENYKKTLDLKASTKSDQLRWVRVLNHLISKTRNDKNTKNLDWTKNERLVDHHFARADKSNDSKIDFKEINAFLESINLKLKKEQVLDLIDVIKF